MVGITFVCLLALSLVAFRLSKIRFSGAVLNFVGMDLSRDEIGFLWENQNWNSNETPTKKVQNCVRSLYLVAVARSDRFDQIVNSNSL